MKTLIAAALMFAASTAFAQKEVLNLEVHCWRTDVLKQIISSKRFLVQRSFEVDVANGKAVFVELIEPKEKLLMLFLIDKSRACLVGAAGQDKIANGVGI